MTRVPLMYMPGVWPWDYEVVVSGDVVGFVRKLDASRHWQAAFADGVVVRETFTSRRTAGARLRNLAKDRKSCMTVRSIIGDR